MPGLRKALLCLYSALLPPLAFQCGYIDFAHATPVSPDAAPAACGDEKCTSVLSAILPAGFAVRSLVQAMPEAGRPAQTGLTPGRYCVARLSKPIAEDGNEVEMSDCILVHPGRGQLELVSETAQNTTAVYTVGYLTRGASLLQLPQPDGTYLIYFAILRESGLVFLPVPLLTRERDAAPASVKLSLAPGAMERLRGKTGFESFGIRSGTPDNIFKWLRNQLGRQFDTGLRNKKIGTRLLETPVYLVRVKQASTADVPIPMKLVEQLHTAIVRAMILE